MIPLATACFGGAVDFLLAFAVLLGMMLYYGIAPTINIVVAAGCSCCWRLATSLGVGLWLSALNVRYRDVRYMVPFITQFWLFATPIAYPSSLLENPGARSTD